MTPEAPPLEWQQIGWNGLHFQLPANWYPTVIYPDYLFFKQEDIPVFEIKWQQVGSSFSAQKSINQLSKSLPEGAQVTEWDLPPLFRNSLADFTVAGFQIEHDKKCSNGLIIFCPECDRLILVQWYIDTGNESQTLSSIFHSLGDHTKSREQVWSIYDVKMILPQEARLKSHELLPGKYTFSFELGQTTFTLYRFKPAAVILNKTSLGIFGRNLLDRNPDEEEENKAFWQYKAKGMDLLLSRLRRKPVWHWMRLWHDPKKNVILGVKAEGKHLTGYGWLETLCENYRSI